MDTDTVTSSNLFRLTGIMAMGIGAAWALQVLGFDGDATAFTRMIWVLAAASIAGAGAGLMIASNGLPGSDAASSRL